LGAVVAALIGVIALTLYLIQSQQDVRSRASEEQTPVTVQETTCPTPSQVQNVLVEFPNCVGDACNFTQASCSWGSVAGATQYQVKISQVESGEVVRDDKVEAATTRIEFSIVQNKTYKCDISAINSCGVSGAAGSHSLLCAVDALVETPTPQPLTPTPTIAKADCGFSCTSTADCKSGLICAQGTSGQGYCAIPAYESTCEANPSISSCCTAPTAPAQASGTPVPTIPPTGDIGSAATVGAGALLLLLFGAALFIL